MYMFIYLHCILETRRVKHHVFKFFFKYLVCLLEFESNVPNEKLCFVKFSAWYLKILALGF
jgi:hypothetical protein